MKKLDKKLLFEKMQHLNPDIGNINEDEQNWGFDTELHNLFQKYGYYIRPVDQYDGVEIKKIEGNENDFNDVMNAIEKNWSEIALPFGEGKEHKKRVNMRGYWGMDDDGDGLVDGSADGGFGGDAGGGE